jgi:hypothetical protein
MWERIEALVLTQDGGSNFPNWLVEQVTGQKNKIGAPISLCDRCNPWLILRQTVVEKCRLGLFSTLKS